MVRIARAGPGVLAGRVAGHAGWLVALPSLRPSGPDPVPRFPSPSRSEFPWQLYLYAGTIRSGFSINLLKNGIAMTLKHDCRRPTPTWLAQLDPNALEITDFSLKEALVHSLYYPACGFDGRPVQFLAGFVHSFIYVDYGNDETAVQAEMQKPGFLGYHLVGTKRLDERGLAPNCWPPRVPPQYQNQMEQLADKRTNGFVKKPFANWYIFDRDDDRAEEHGPKRFSLVYLCADGVAAYQALYWQNHRELSGCRTTPHRV